MHVWMVTEALQNHNFTFAVNLSLYPSEVDKLNTTVNSKTVVLNKTKHLFFSAKIYMSFCLP